MIQEANLHWRYIDTETNLIMPWYTLPCLQWIKEQNIEEWDVFEYGAGYSTCWWKMHCKTLFSVESDSFWAGSVGAAWIRDPAKYVLMPIVAYDCIIVDGIEREACIEYARFHVKEGGYMIIDNYGQEDCPPVERIDSLLEGWGKRLFKQPNHSTWTTAVFRKPV